MSFDPDYMRSLLSPDDDDEEITPAQETVAPQSTQYLRGLLGEVDDDVRRSDAVSGSLERNSGRAPAAVGEARRLSQELGLPQSAVEEQLPRVRAERAARTPLPFDTKLDLAEMLATDDDAAAVFRNDLDALGSLARNVERKSYGIDGEDISFPELLGDKFEMGVLQVEISQLRNRQIAGRLFEFADLSTSERGELEEKNARMLELQQRIAGYDTFFDNEVGRFFEEIPAEVVGQTPIFGYIGINALAGAAIGTVFGLPSVGAAVGRYAAGIQLETGLLYNDLIEIEDVDPDLAVAMALVGGGISGAAEGFGAGAIAKLMRGTVKRAAVNATLAASRGQLARAAVGRAVLGGAEEGFTELFQGAVQETSLVFLEHYTSTDSFSEAVDKTYEDAPRIFESAVAEARAGLQGGLGFSSGTAAIGYARDVRAIEQARAGGQFINDVIDGTLDAEEAVKSAPDKVGEMVARAAAKGNKPTEVGVPVDKFNEFFQGQNLSPAEVAQAMGVADEYAEASESGVSDVVIPIDKFVEHLVVPGHARSMEGDIRVGDGLTQNEASELMSTLQDRVPTAREEMADESHRVALLEAERTRITNEKAREIVDTGVYPEDVAEELAGTYARSVIVTAASTGLSVDEVLREVPLRIVGPSSAPDVVLPSDVELRQEDEVSLTDDIAQLREAHENVRSLVFESGTADDTIVLSDLVVEERTDRGQGLGTAFMNDLVEMADRQGVRITLTPGVRDPAVGTTSRGRLVRFYKRFGFVENKGRNKDFRISDGMYREPTTSRMSEREQSRMTPEQRINAKMARLTTEVPGLAKALGLLRGETDVVRGKLQERTAQKIVDIMDNAPSPSEMASVAFSGRAKRGWYKQSAQAILDVFGISDAPRFTALLAAFSPRTSVENNLTNALNIWAAWNEAGRPTDPGAIDEIFEANVLRAADRKPHESSMLPAWRNNGISALTSEDPGSLTLSGPKANSFAENLRGDVNAVTLDSWMAKFAGWLGTDLAQNKSLNPNDPGFSPIYLAYSAQVRRAAEILTRRTGETWTPAEIQETVWSWAKASAEGAKNARMSVEEFATTALTAENILATPDFGTLFTQGVYKQILERGGYDLGRLTQEGRAASGSIDGDPISFEGSGIGQVSFERDIRRASRRLARAARGVTADPVTGAERGVAVELEQPAPPRPPFPVEIEPTLSDPGVPAAIFLEGPLRGELTPGSVPVTGVFFSKMERVAGQKLPGKGTGQEYIDLMEKFAKKGEFKREEWEWSGLREMLEGFPKDQKVRKALVMDLLHRGGVVQRIREIPGRLMNEAVIGDGEVAEPTEGGRGEFDPDYFEQEIEERARSEFDDSTGVRDTILEGEVENEESNARDEIKYAFRNNARNNLRLTLDSWVRDQSYETASFVEFIEEEYPEVMVPADDDAPLLPLAGVERRTSREATLVSRLEDLDGTEIDDEGKVFDLEEAIDEFAELMGERRSELGVLDADLDNYWEVYEHQFIADATEQMRREWENGEIHDDGGSQDDPQKHIGYVSPFRELKESYNEIKLAIPFDANSPGQPWLNQDHYSDPNILVFSRYDRRQTDLSQNEKRDMLFIQEIQSDWLQELSGARFHGEIDTKGWSVVPSFTGTRWRVEPGPDGGFNVIKSYVIDNVVVSDWQHPTSHQMSSFPNEELALDYMANRTGAQQKFVNVKDADGKIVGRVSANHDSYADTQAFANHAIREVTYRLRNNTPKAPFGSSWPLLMFKRMLRQAVIDGDEYIGWTTGAQQNVRYRGAQQRIEWIEWKRTSDVNRIELRARLLQEDGSPVERGDDTILRSTMVDELGNLVGADVAKQIRDELATLPQDSNKITNDRMLFTGHGLPAFYDVRLVNLVKKYVKRWGGKVEKIPLAAGEHRRRKVDEVWGVRITDQMRDALGEADGLQELFQPDDTNDSSARGSIILSNDPLNRPNVLKLTETSDLSTFLHEMGHLWLHTLERMSQREDVSDSYRSLWLDVQRWFDDSPPSDRDVFKTAEAMLARQEEGRAWSSLSDDEKARYNFHARENLAHERFAQAVESYFHEGRAPTAELRSVFARFRTWMLAIYRDFQRIFGRAPHEDIRHVLDRMVATEEEIAQAEAGLGYGPDPGLAAGMTPSEYRAYVAANQKANDQATSELQRSVMEDLRRQRSARGRDIRRRARQSVEFDLRSDPIQQARDWLSTGKWIGDEGDAPEERIRIDAASLVDRYGDEIIGQLPKGPWRVHAIGDDASRPVDVLAADFGVGPDELVQGIVSRGTLTQETKRRTDERMREIYPALTNEELVEAADEAVRNDARGDVFSRELAALGALAAQQVRPVVEAQAEGQVEGEGPRTARERAEAVDAAQAELDAAQKALGDARAQDDTQAQQDAEGALEAAVARLRRAQEARAAAIRARARGSRSRQERGAQGLRVQQLRDEARLMVQATRVRRLRLGRWSAEERRLNERARKLAAEGDVAGSIEAKERAIFYHYAYREGARARDRSASTREYLASFNRSKARQRLALAGQSYLDQVDQLLERYEFRQRTQREIDSRQSLVAWVDQQTNDGLPTDFPDHIMDEARARNWRDLTFGELEGVRDAVSVIEHQSKLKSRLLGNAKHREFKAAKEQLLSSIEEKNIWNDPQRRTFQNFIKREVGSQLSSVHSHLARPEFIFRRLDGGESLGIAWEMFYEPVNQAQHSENILIKNAVDQLDILRNRSFSRAEQVTLRSRRHFIPEIGRALTKEQILAVALNWGNEGNRTAIRNGYGWTDSQILAVLDRLEQSEWEFVQGVWDLIDSYWTPSKELEERLAGIAPPKVQAVEVETKFGTYPGGYYPLRYDGQQSIRFANIESAEANKSVEELYANRATRAMTRTGHLNERVEHENKPVALRLNVIDDHIGNVIHDLTHREAILGADRLLRDKDISSALVGVLGLDSVRMLQKWLFDIAHEQYAPRNFIESTLDYTRRGASIMAMGLKATTAITQVLGYLTTADEIGSRYTLQGIIKMATSTASQMTGNQNWALKESQVLRDRRTNFNAEVRQALNKGSLGGNIDAMRSSFFMFTGAMDMFVSVGTWHGAYAQAIDGNAGANIEPGDHDAAVRYADAVVRLTQGTGYTKDLANVQRGDRVQLAFSMFYSYFSVLYNRYAEIHNERQHGRVGVERIVTGAIWLWAIPAIAGELIVGRFPDDDEETWEWIAKNGLAYAATPIPILSSVVNGAVRGYDVSIAPGLEAFNVFKDAAVQIGQGELDAGALRVARDAAGYWGHLPTRQMWITGQAFMDWVEGDHDFHPIDLLFSKPRGKR